MEHFFSPDGGLMRFFYKTGEILIVGILWLIGCIPILTIGTSSAAAYYAMVKSVRRGRGYVWTEFLRAYKKNFKQGCIVSLWLLIISLLTYAGYRWYVDATYDPGRLWKILFGIAIVGTLLIMTYISAVMSRFNMKFSAVCAMAFVMSIRFWYLTLGIWVFTIALGVLYYLLLNLPFLLVLPGLWIYLCSFPVEFALSHYMPEQTDAEEWYATTKKRVEKKHDTNDETTEQNE